MIRVRRLNGRELILNADLIKSMEATPDTVLTLLSGEKLMVLDSVDEVVEKVVQFKKRVFQEPLRQEPLGATADGAG